MRRTQQLQRTDRDITDALLRLMDRKGIEKISVQEILEEAKINRSTFYQHFSDKYAILERLQENYVSGMTSRIDEIAQSGTWDIAVINDKLCGYLRENRAQMRRILAVRSENLNLEGRMRTVFAAYLNRSESGLDALETEILANVTVQFFVYFIKNEIDERELSTRMLDTWLDMTVYFFRVDRTPDAKERFLHLVGELHRQQA